MARIEEDTTHEVYLTDEEMHRINEGGVAVFEINGDEVRVGAEPEYFEEPDYPVPNDGMHVFDPEAPRWSSGEMEVIEVTDVPADEYEITVKGRDTTVFRENPSCDPDAPVVRARYVAGSDRIYAFPCDRLDY
ncbi:hypothetical protein M199_gp109 [Halogranum tailed virus 1]|uniref:Uncharacterized protein n=1 Tax=Halogranum tailed virus 1 TaxID=1273749 RepID=R4TLI4_9CAUD|nr:hypothetical protein M199_gp109 [Halogranum tailed virus 1]AGM11557.1 hypothetical protein HGTV1_260 [Halogranum tailed virus 1]